MDDIVRISNKFQCKYCKKLKQRNNIVSSYKYFCKKNKDEDLNELVRLLNEQNNLKDEQIKEMENRVHEMSKNYEKMQKQINQLTNKLQLQKMGNTIIHNGNQINNSIQVLNHKETNYDFLTDRDYIKCIKSVNHCVKSLIETVHFNDKHPENMNIYVPSMKTDYLMV